MEWTVNGRFTEQASVICVAGLRCPYQKPGIDLALDVSPEKTDRSRDAEELCDDPLTMPLHTWRGRTFPSRALVSHCRWYPTSIGWQRTRGRPSTAQEQCQWLDVKSTTARLYSVTRIIFAIVLLVPLLYNNTLQLGMHCLEGATSIDGYASFRTKTYNIRESASRDSNKVHEAHKDDSPL